MFQFFHIPTRPAMVCLFKIVTILVSRGQYLAVVLICVSVRTNNVEHLFEISETLK